MKKFIVLSLIGLLIMAFSATVYAQPKLEFKASGFIDAQSLWYENVPISARTSGTKFLPKPIYGWIDSDFSPYLDAKKAFDRPIAYWESRARLKFDAIMDKNLSGTIFFEMDSTRWGDTLGGQGGGISERNTYGYWASGDRAAVEIKNIYVDFGLPYIGIPIPMTVRVGLQPISLRPNMLLYNDGMGIIGGIDLSPVKISPIYAKPYEGLDHVADDWDVYGLHVNAKVATFTFGGYGLFYNMNSYPMLVVSNPNSATLPAAFSAFITGTMKSNAYWLGVYADGKAGPVDVNFDFIYDRGKVESKFTPTAEDVKYRGWATRVKVDFPWEKFNFGVVGMYASGADMRKTSVSGLPGTTVAAGQISFLNAHNTTMSSKVSSYVTPPGSEQYAIFQEGLVFYPSFVDRSDHGFYTPNAFSMSRGSIGGTWMAKAYASVKATPWYKVTLQGMYIGDTTKHGNTVGTATRVSAFGLEPRDDKTIGWEFGLINEIQIYKNLKWTIGAGILFGGDALDQAVLAGAVPAPVPFVNKSPNNPWAVLTNLTYTF